MSVWVAADKTPAQRANPFPKSIRIASAQTHFRPKIAPEMRRRGRDADVPRFPSMSTAVPLVGRPTTTHVLLNASTYLGARLAACEGPRARPF
jgi:hypothetical protein